MYKIHKIAFCAAAFLLLCGCGQRNTNMKQEEDPVVVMTTSKGVMKIKLYNATARHRDNFLKLTDAKFFDNLKFHRVIEGFMIQGGDPLSRDDMAMDRWGTGGPGYTVPAEIDTTFRHKKGALAAARQGDLANPRRASSGSQFYIVQSEEGCSHLDGQYTVFGEVTEGLDVIDAIASVPTDPYDRPLVPVVILSVRRDTIACAPAAAPDSLSAE